MKKYLINNGSETLLVFFTGWGCDESEFSRLKADTDVFAKNYLIKTEEERKKFHHSKRTTESCHTEFLNLKKLYFKYKKLARERVARQTR